MIGMVKFKLLVILALLSPCIQVKANRTGTLTMNPFLLNIMSPFKIISNIHKGLQEIPKQITSKNNKASLFLCRNGKWKFLIGRFWLLTATNKITKYSVNFL